ncbi:anti-sigma factor family protein [Streptomyces sp. NPDC053048]|uniref:anti-sigma factor family protein n=1 Tax=Streptomyces sp. NPDC053048 TaxID=3365694 RepID=UPI0037D47FEC
MSTAPRPDDDGAARTSPARVPRTRAPRSHPVLKSLLGAWALAACSAEETAAVESHLTDCAGCAEEAVRLRDAVALLHPEDGLDLDPTLRSRVLAGALVRRPARIPVPGWAAPYEAETARLDALLHDIGETEWHTPVRLNRPDGRRSPERDITVAGVIGHLTAVDGIVAEALGLAGAREPAPADGPDEHGRAHEAECPGEAPPSRIHAAWREQGRSLIRTVSFGGGRVAGLTVEYGPFGLPLRDALLERAFGCWVHAGNIADAIDYPYEPPSSPHLHDMIDLAARMLPTAIAGRRRAGLAPPPRTLVAAGTPGRALHLEIEGRGGGHWYIALDSPGAIGSREGEVAHVALDGVEFCRLAAGHVAPEEAAAGSLGDAEAVRDVLYATASLTRI